MADTPCKIMALILALSWHLQVGMIRPSTGVLPPGSDTLRRISPAHHDAVSTLATDSAAPLSLARLLSLWRLLRHILHQLFHPAVEVGTEPAQILGAGVVAPLIHHLGQRHPMDTRRTGHLTDGDSPALGKLFPGHQLFDFKAYHASPQHNHASNDT